MKRRDPINDQEWQDAVDTAENLLAIYSAKLYGLIETDLKIDVNRCDEILRRGKAAGYVPSRDAIQRIFRRVERSEKGGR